MGGLASIQPQKHSAAPTSKPSATHWPAAKLSARTRPGVSVLAGLPTFVRPAGNAIAWIIIASGSTIAMSGPNIGDELNAKHITWGWFQGGFTPTANVGGIAVCGSTHTNIGGAVVPDYSSHHEPFQYYASTANPSHLPPATEAEIGHNGQANHQYDLSNFYTTLTSGNMPSVSFLKAAKYQDGHAG